MPFRFSLQEVLEYRRRIEEMRQREMHDMQRQVDYVQGLVTQARQRRVHYRNELNQKVQEGMIFAYQQLYINYIYGLERLIEKSEHHLEQLRRDLERRRKRLSEAARDRHVLDELRKEELRAYLLNEKRIETKAFDEIAIRNFVVSEREKTAGASEESIL